MMFYTVDLDECLVGQLEEREVCESGIERCVNTEGGFECAEECKAGYQPDPADLLGPCIDIDECSANGTANHTCTLAEKYVGVKVPSMIYSVTCGPSILFLKVRQYAGILPMRTTETCPADGQFYDDLNCYHTNVDD